MRSKIILLLLVALNSNAVFAQNTFQAIIKDSETKEPLIGATALLEGTTNGASADTNGLVTISNIPNGEQEIQFRFMGYEEQEQEFEFPMASTDPIEIFLSSEADELNEVVVSSTRSTRTIKDIPTRVEFIAGEELEEKGNMKSGDIRMLLNESTGIQTQQTSATSANASIRIQGLDGRYTQILKDGFPLYSGASSGLGLLQTPPLDLKQVELIKGSASTLYGGGAIAGLVNLISKTPEEKRELTFHLNGSSGKGFDLNGFYGQRFKKVGTTIFAAHNRNWAYDPAEIGLTAIPKFERYVLNPKLFVFFNEKSKLNFGVNTTIETRLGGDIKYIEGQGDSIHSYFEENKTQRYSTQLAFDHRFNDTHGFSFKNSVSYFNRQITIPDFAFDGTQIASFTEATYSNTKEKTEWVAGVNLWTDNFQEKQLDTLSKRNYDLITIGSFAQNTWKATKWLNLETGFRTDYVVDHGFAFLPRLAALFQITPKITSRVGGGFGYKAPTIFTEESERIQYRNVLAINSNTNQIEKSYGANVDVNYRTSFADDRVSFSINQLFFFTYIDKPLLLQPQASGLYQFINANGNTNTKGTETNIKIGYAGFKLFLGYTFTDTRSDRNGVVSETPLTPKHRLNTILMYEIEEKWKFGVEAYYFSPQKLSDGTTGEQYVICGFMAEKLWERISIYVNFENFLDVRQTRFDSIYTGTVTNPVFKDVYAPLDGFLFNGGVKIRL
jgi:outer membrane receptor for ferrienterochelin and colicins